MVLQYTVGSIQAGFDPSWVQSKPNLIITQKVQQISFSANCCDFVQQKQFQNGDEVLTDNTLK